MADKAPVWDRIVERHGLVPIAHDRIAPSWQFMDFLFRHGSLTPHHSLMSTIKARQYGFDACIDTEVMLVELFNEMRARGWLPG